MFRIVIVVAILWPPNTSHAMESSSKFHFAHDSYIYNLQITNPPELETRINQIPGVVTVGIFAHRPADVLIVASDTGIRTIGA